MLNTPDFYARQGLFRRTDKGFSVRTARTAGYIRNGPKDYAKCIRKYRIAPTSLTPFFFDPKASCLRRYIKQQHEQNMAALSSVLGLDLGGQVRLADPKRQPAAVQVPAVNQDPDDGMTVVTANDIQNDTEYACPVTIGTPGITLLLDFDTGSSDLWVWSSEYRASCSDLQGHSTYNPKKSSTSELLPGETWQISYGDGSHASGDVHLDTVVIGDIEIKRQAVEVAQQLSSEFVRGGSDGLLGLAFPRLNTVKPHRQKTPIQNMIEQGLVKDPIFTVKLDKHDSRGFYTFGYIDDTVHASKLYWQPLVQDTDWWEVPSAYIKIGSDIYDRVAKLYSKVPGARLDQNQGGYIFPTNARLPALAFCVGHWLFTVPSGDLAFSGAGAGMVYGAVQSRGQNPQDILGDVSDVAYCLSFQTAEQYTRSS
ncbi:aspartyl protease [Ceratobasidium sp. AG-Ba]|nr:aspartyl protease [Ceratobasidium sp. AG-Ba]QRW10218.1 aspartyl protease [Ceratobasidium sp. AG-Ba]